MVYLFSLGDVEGFFGNRSQRKLLSLKKFLELVIKTRSVISEGQHRSSRNKYYWIYLIDFSENKSPIDLGKRGYLI